MWNKIKDGLPKDEKQIYIFIEWHERWQTVNAEYIGTLESIRLYREYELKNNYTHWMKFEKP